LPSNALKTKHYDQIAFIVPELKDKLELFRAGAFDFYRYLYREGDENLYAEEMDETYGVTHDGASVPEEERAGYYGAWRTYHMSDPLPTWIELRTDFGKEYLSAKVAGTMPE